MNAAIRNVDDRLIQPNGHASAFQSLMRITPDLIREAGEHAGTCLNQEYFDQPRVYMPEIVESFFDDLGDGAGELDPGRTGPNDYESEEFLLHACIICGFGLLERGQDDGSDFTGIVQRLLLKGIDFPANKEDLLEHAKKNGAEDAVLEMIEKMPDGEFGNMADVMSAYGDADEKMGGGRQERG